MTPTPGDVHVNQPLGNISIAYIQDQSGFVADRVFATVPVNKQSDVYFRYDFADWNRESMARRAPATESAGQGYKIDSSASYYATVWAEHVDIDDQVRANADQPIDMDRDVTQFLTQQALLNREIQWASAFYTTGIWTGSHSGTDIAGAAVDSTDQDLRWDITTSTPLEDVARESDAIKLASGFRPNKLVLGAQTWTALKNHPEIVDRIKFSGGVSPANPAIVNQAAVAQLMNLEEILVMDAIKVTSNENNTFEGGTITTSFIGGKNALLVFVQNAPSLMKPSAGYTFSWTGYLGASPMGIRLKSFRRQPEVPADRVEIEQAYAQKLVAAKMGAFWTGIVS